MTTKSGITLGTIVRTLLLVLALGNQILTSTGHSPLPIDDSQITDLAALSATVITSIIAWWENQSFTREAIIADNYMEELKNEKSAIATDKTFK